MLLAKLKESAEAHLGHPVSEAVITVPALALRSLASSSMAYTSTLPIAAQVMSFLCLATPG